MHAELNACMSKLLGACMRKLLGACMRILGALKYGDAGQSEI